VTGDCFKELPKPAGILASNGFPLIAFGHKLGIKLRP